MSWLLTRGIGPPLPYVFNQVPGPDSCFGDRSGWMWKIGMSFRLEGCGGMGWDGSAEWKGPGGHGKE